MSNVLSCGDVFSSCKDSLTGHFPEKINLRSEDTRFLAISPSDDTAEDPKEPSKFSYSIEFLLSLAKTVSFELPEEDRLSISLGFEDGLLSPPFSDSDSRLDTSVPLLPHLKVTNKINGSLHKSNIPYCPPHRHKELYEPSGFPNSIRLQKGEEKRWKRASHEQKSYADKASLPQEDKRHVNKDRECNKCSESFLLSLSSGNFSDWQSSSKATEQMDSPYKPCLIQEKSEACSNLLNVRHPERIPGVMEFHEKSRPPIFKKKVFEFGKDAKCEVLDNLVSPPVEDNKPFLSIVDKLVMAKDNLFFDGVDQAIPLSAKQNSSTCDCQNLRDLNLNTFSKLEEKPHYSSDIWLPDEDSLIRFDEPFLKPDDRNWDAVDQFVSSPEKNPIDDGMHSPTSPGDMIVKLVESILEDESPPAPHPVDPEAYHNCGFSARLSHARFCRNQLSPGWDQQVRNASQRNFIDSTTYSSLTHHYSPSNTILQPFHLFPNKMTKFDHTGPPMLQQMKYLDPPYPSSFRRSLGGVTRNLSMHQMGSRTHYRT